MALALVALWAVFRLARNGHPRWAYRAHARLVITAYTNAGFATAVFLPAFRADALATSATMLDIRAFRLPTPSPAGPAGSNAAGLDLWAAGDSPAEACRAAQTAASALVAALAKDHGAEAVILDLPKTADRHSFLWDDVLGTFHRLSRL